MAGKAQQELQGLLDMQSQGVSAAGRAAKLLETRDSPEFVSSGEQAEFAMPEALATAVGAGWLLGPVGGLLLGAAQGILGKKEEQRAIDAMAAETEVIRKTDDVFNGELQRLALTATSPEDMDQLSALQTQKDAALQMMASPFPESQERGSAMLSDFTQRLNEYAVRQETQRIEADAFDKQLARELDNTQVARYKESIGRFNNESAAYLDVMNATDVALQALANGTPADLWAAGILVNKALDPSSVVREEEAAAVGRLGSLWDKANVYLEKARSGETILPKQRRELSDLLYKIRETGTKFQLAREARYSDEINDIDLPAKYHDNFRLAKTVPAAAPGDIEMGTLPAEDTLKIVQDKAAEFAEGGASAWERFKEWSRQKMQENAEREGR